MIVVDISLKMRYKLNTRQLEVAVKRIEAIIKPFKVDEVKEALAEIGIHAMTVIGAEGLARKNRRHGQAVPKGQRQTYIMDPLIPKVVVMVIVTDDMVNQVIETLASAAKDGRAGDGKIIVSPVDEFIRIRTGERGKDAL